MEFFCNYIWEQGLREKNEDSLCIRQIRKNGTDYLLAVVCDGIGGLEEGEHASSFTVNCMREFLRRFLKNKRRLSSGVIRNAVNREVYKCHRQLQQYGKEKGIRLGTTLSMILIVGRTGHVFHIGDSAVFAGKRGMKRLTPVQQDKTGALQQAVGTGNNPVPFYRKVRVKSGMVFVLASDGFYQKSEHRICKEEWVKRMECSEKRIAELLQAVKENVQALGEKDNISAIGMKVR